jgi:hypothetical protein
MNEFENQSNLSNEAPTISNSPSDETLNNFYRPTEQLNSINPKSNWNDAGQPNFRENQMPPPPPPPQFQGKPHYLPSQYISNMNQPPFPPPFSPMYPYMYEPTDNKKGFAITSLVLGIVSMVMFCISFFTVIVGVLGIIFGVLGLKSSGKGMAIAGIITSAVGLLSWVGIIIIWIISFMSQGYLY